jgi:hypothetical protein
MKITFFSWQSDATWIVALDHALRVIAGDRGLGLIVADALDDLHAHHAALGVDLSDGEAIRTELVGPLIRVGARLRNVEADDDRLLRRRDHVDARERGRGCGDASGDESPATGGEIETAHPGLLDMDDKCVTQYFVRTSA